MRVTYDPEADAAYVAFADAPVEQVREVSDVCVLDISSDGKVVGIEMLSVFGFAGASLADLVVDGIVDRPTAEAILADLRVRSRAA